ncbi:hypothetical protein OOK41_01350 [Micromonospora sp. NBC_01655]|uniref:hypothetical protein n=1 Tax=Micromonospora sp. NBC_01655 TaxID=2975983 RepID=UPI0022587E2C|nr:hypothetical protein [Micromonospora sp. NBC_01655]MCX4468970.1 hypothetical protein [Micromonospora sp. NBC_01655]
MSDTSLVFNAVGRDKGVNSLLQRTAQNVRSVNLSGAASTVALGGAMASAAGYAVALGSSALGAVGAIGLLPGVIAATAATVLAAKAVTFGLGDAWSATGKAATGGGGAAAGAGRRVAMAQRQVESATRALADAQRDALVAQAAVTRAREEETERLSDLSRSVVGAKLDEEAAMQAVTRAERELAAARMSGNVDDIIAADLAYRQSQHTLDEVRDRVDDLGKEQADGAKKGVEGSDAVQDALQRQRDAQQAVTDAAQRLADAQAAVGEASAGAASGGIDPAAEALARLSPAGRDVIRTLRSLAPAWQDAARGGQQAALRGVAGDLRALSGIYLPGVTTWLRRMGGGFNLAIRESLGLFKTQSAAADVGRVLDSTALTVHRLAAAVRPVLNGLLQWATIGASFLPGFASNVGSVAQRFERWSTAARESGRMRQWIAGALGVLSQLGAIARDVGMSVVAIFRAGGDGGAFLTNLQRGAALLRAWTESAEGQERIRAVFASLRNIIGGIAGAFAQADSPRSAFVDGLNVAGPVLKFAADHTDLLAKALPFLAAGFVISRVAQVGANVAAVASLPLKAAEVAANWGMRSAIKAQTAALVENTAVARGAAAASRANTAASVAGEMAAKRSVAAWVAQKFALLGARIATIWQTVAQWALNIAQMASPTTWIILAIVALIAVIVLIATKTTWFQDAWKASWKWIKAAAAAVGDWFVNTLYRRWILGAYNGIINGGKAFLNWYFSLPGRLIRALVNISRIISSPFRAAFNAIARLWNNTVGRLRFQAPSWVPGIGGKGFNMPQLPMLAKGGTATRAGLAIVGEEGPEVVHLGAGASVIPLPTGGTGGGRGAGGGVAGGEVRVIVVGGDRDAVAYLRRLFGQYGFGGV